ncbi:MAG TPA: ABC transporter permease [Firmicutes bacterium]|nr:ABC transporter permease [Bacillota bacterium]
MPETVATVELASAVAPRTSEWKRFLRVFLQRKVVWFALFIIALLFFTAIFAPWLAPYDPNQQNFAHSMAPPSREHLLGTDRLGIDTFSRLIWGARTCLIIGLATTFSSAAVGTILGLLAGYMGGWVNTVIMRFMDALMGFPMIVLALLLAGVLGSGMINLIIALTVASVPGYTRLMCGMTLTVKENDYILAQRAIGSSSFRTLAKHIFPNALQPMIVMVTTALGGIILAEAGLSFLGVGITAPDVAWGSMVAVGYQFLKTNPILSMAPGIAVMLVVFSFNIVGDGLRDALDPRLRGTL